LNTTEVELI